MMCDQLLNGDGASRVHGGGFAGTVQVYVPINLIKDFTQKAKEVFGEDSVTPLTIRGVSTCRVDNF